MPITPSQHVENAAAAHPCVAEKKDRPSSAAAATSGPITLQSEGAPMSTPLTSPASAVSRFVLRESLAVAAVLLSTESPELTPDGAGTGCTASIGGSAGACATILPCVPKLSRAAGH